MEKVNTSEACILISVITGEIVSMTTVACSNTPALSIFHATTYND